MDDSASKRTLTTDINSIDYGVYTHIGRRQHNQDAVLLKSIPVSDRGEGWLFAVADGMGGHPGGCLAGRLACDGLNRYFSQSVAGKFTYRPAEVCRYLTEATVRIDRDIRFQGAKDSRLADMGTTLSCLFIVGNRGVIAHVGDSRIYRLRKGFLSCLTVDHTFVQDMIFEGEVDPADAHLHPLRHVLTNAVGAGEPLSLVDSRIDPLQIKDRYLLCSDGLTNAIADRGILDLLSVQSTASQIATQLVTTAFQNGARDNITAVVIDLEGYENSYNPIRNND